MFCAVYATNTKFAALRSDPWKSVDHKCGTYYGLLTGFVVLLYSFYNMCLLSPNFVCFLFAFILFFLFPAAGSE